MSLGGLVAKEDFRWLTKPVAVMVLHELLLALVGHTGELIVPVRDPLNKKVPPFFFPFSMSTNN